MFRAGLIPSGARVPPSHPQPRGLCPLQCVRLAKRGRAPRTWGRRAEPSDQRPGRFARRAAGEARFVSCCGGELHAYSAHVSAHRSAISLAKMRTHVRTIGTPSAIRNTNQLRARLRDGRPQPGAQADRSAHPDDRSAVCAGRAVCCLLRSRHGRAPDEIAIAP